MAFIDHDSHLLLGLIRARVAVAADIVTGMGVALDDIRQEVEAIFNNTEDAANET